MNKIAREEHVVSLMITMYCRHKHGGIELCPDCRQLLTYAHQRLSRCPFGEEKSSCRRCRVHCYAPEMRLKISVVMRYSGPRMMLHHPLLALRHLLA